MDYSDFCIVSIYYRLLPTELKTTKTHISPELLFVHPDTTGMGAWLPSVPPITVLLVASESHERKMTMIKTVFCQVRISLATDMSNSSKAGLARFLGPDFLCVSTVAMALPAQHFLAKQQDLEI